MSMRRSINPTRKRILEKLQTHGPMTKHQIAEVCYVAIRNVNEYLNLMHEDLEVYIHDWIRTGTGGGPWLKVWAAGCEKDARKPKALTPAERSRKRRQDPEVAIDELLRKRSQRFNERMRRLHGNTTEGSGAVLGH